jgi:hypothetical protein
MQIFISHKAKDAPTLERVVESFRRNNDINFEWSKDFDVGDRFNEKIVQKIADCDCMILFYTDPTEDWNWCMKEVGMFQMKRHLNGHKDATKSGLFVIYVHEEQTIPEALRSESIHALNGTNLKDVKNFLSMLFGVQAGGNGDFQALQPVGLANRANAIVERLNNLKGTLSRPKYLLSAWKIWVKDLQQIREKEVLSGHSWVKSEGHGFHHFGLNDDITLPWEDFRSYFGKRGNEDVINMIEQAIIENVRSNSFLEVREKINTENGSDVNLVLFRSEMFFDGTRKYNVLLVPHHGEKPVRHEIDDPLLNIINFGFAFKMRALGLAHQARLQPNRGPAHVMEKKKSYYSEFRDVLNELTAQAQDKGWTNPDVIKQMFQSNLTRLDEVEFLFDEWKNIIGDFHTAFEEDDFDTLDSTVKSMSNINLRFMHMASEQQADNYRQLLGYRREGVKSRFDDLVVEQPRIN